MVTTVGKLFKELTTDNLTAEVPEQLKVDIKNDACYLLRRKGDSTFQYLIRPKGVQQENLYWRHAAANDVATIFEPTPVPKAKAVSKKVTKPAAAVKSTRAKTKAKDAK